jgi:succinate dehydrogenase / fumarate reductase cytochrome b subunit
MGISGLMLSGFIVIHLLGNLALLSPDRDPFNKYAHFLLNLGTILYVAEFALAAVFIIHFVYGIYVTIGNWRARPVNYKMVTNAGNTSKKSIASSTMIWTGLLVLIFTVLHLLHFKYGAVYMYTTADGQYIRDLYETVYRFFASEFNVAFYVIVMVLLGFHLSHGVWSAFQSLGLNSKSFTPTIRRIGYAFAVVMGFGFVLIPILVYWDIFKTLGGTV